MNYRQGSSESKERILIRQAKYSRLMPAPPTQIFTTTIVCRIMCLEGELKKKWGNQKYQIALCAMEPDCAVSVKVRKMSAQSVVGEEA